MHDQIEERLAVVEQELNRRNLLRLRETRAKGGLALSRYTASFALLVVIMALILIFPQEAG